jgi:hypothetical protein
VDTVVVASAAPVEVVTTTVAPYAVAEAPAAPESADTPADAVLAPAVATAFSAATVVLDDVLTVT